LLACIVDILLTPCDFQKKKRAFNKQVISEHVANTPDKVCDQISDSLVDAYLSKDNQSRLAIETFATTNRVIIGGEIRAPEISKNDVENIIRQTVKEIGYEQSGFNWKIICSAFRAVFNRSGTGLARNITFRIISQSRIIKIPTSRHCIHALIRLINNRIIR